MEGSNILNSTQVNVSNSTLVTDSSLNDNNNQFESAVGVDDIDFGVSTSHCNEDEFNVDWWSTNATQPSQKQIENSNSNPMIDSLNNCHASIPVTSINNNSTESQVAPLKLTNSSNLEKNKDQDQVYDDDINSKSNPSKEPQISESQIRSQNILANLLSGTVGLNIINHPFNLENIPISKTVIETKNESKNIPLNTESLDQQSIINNTKNIQHFIHDTSEWDAIKDITLQEKDSDDEHDENLNVQNSNIDIESVLNYFVTMDFSALEIKPEIQKKGLQAFISLFTGPPKLKHQLETDRNICFYLAQIPFENNNDIHYKMIQTVYKTLTGNQFDCPKYGGHWEDIGFQGNDPTTDFRGLGILGLICIHYFVTSNDAKPLLAKIYLLSRDPQQNFPFCLIGINLTSILIQSIRLGSLNAIFNKRLNVLYPFFEMFCALFVKFYYTWYIGHKSIIDTGNVLKEIELLVSKKPNDLLSFYQLSIDSPDTFLHTTSGSAKGQKSKKQLVQFSNLD